MAEEGQQTEQAVPAQHQHQPTHQHQHGDQPQGNLPPGMHPSFMRVIQQKQRVKQKLSAIKHKIGVYSAKGGVGKTTVAINIAYSLMKKGFKVGLLDADIDCPNVTMFLGIEERMEPVMPLKPIMKNGVKVASTEMLVDELKRPIIWRGPIVVKMLGDFFENTDWGELDYLIIDLPPGCMPAGTPILMADNTTKMIESIKPGEVIFSYKGNELIENKVVDVISQGKRQVFCLETPKRTIAATANHPFLKYSHGTVSWKRVSELKPRDRIVVVNSVPSGKSLKLPKINESVHNTYTRVTIPSFTDANFMRIIGHFVGDGYIRINRSKNKIIGLRICEPQGSKFRAKYEALYKEVFNCNIFNDGTQFAISSLSLIKLFQHLDLDHPALKKHIPSWIFSLPVDQRLAFIEGYSEADGHIRHREVVRLLPRYNGQIEAVKIISNTVSVASTNEQLVKQIHQLCQISGIRTSNVRKRARTGNTLSTGRVIGPSVQHEFDYSQKISNKTFKLERIRSIYPAGDMETYDIQLDANHNFIAKNSIVHNTSDAPLTIMQVLDLDGFVIVTNPQKIAGMNSIRSGLMAKRLGVAVLGVVENMSSGKPSEMTMEVVKTLDTEFLGSVERKSEFADMTDNGKIHVMESKEIENTFDSITKKIAGK
jgi:Mrp family chromosome partitioning ATPase/intein/homing endonuclease